MVRATTATATTNPPRRPAPTRTTAPIGGRLGIPSPAAPDRAPPIRFEIAFLTDDLDLIPFPGRPLSVDADVETDLDRVVVKLGERPVVGGVLEAVSEIAPTVSAARTATVALRQVDEIAGTFSEQARILSDESGVLDQLVEIEETMRTDWQLDPTAPGGGQQLALIERFITDTQRGTSEQFVTAFVLLVRSLGFDARVATGFVVPPDQLSTPLTIESTQASVWPEVRLEGVGWLAFDPVPPVETTDTNEPPPPPDAQSPAAAQPPIAPPAEEADDSDETSVDTRDDGGGWESFRTWLVRTGTIGGIALLPFVVSIGSILAVKWRRRRRRLRVADPAVRIRGVWANTTDRLVDAGLTIAPAWTDDRIADAAAPIAPTTPHEMRRLASMSTSMTFGSTTDAWRLIDDAVLTSTAVEQAICAGIDMVMVPFDYQRFITTVVELVDVGRIPLVRIDDAVGRILHVRAEMGLVAEPFVFGIDTMIDRMTESIPGAAEGFRLIFSTSQFPGAMAELQWRREEADGNWYFSPTYEIEGWLCPALFKYFDEAPKALYAKAEALPA